MQFRITWVVENQFSDENIASEVFENEDIAVDFMEELIERGMEVFKMETI